MNREPSSNETDRPPVSTAKAAELADRVEDNLERFWRAGEELDEVEVLIEPSESPLELLEQLGTSPFERGSFPLIGFLATTYDKVSRDALDRR
ncbi:MAG: hypothetical protein IH897_06265 [Planctomycetes bacterium]|nr:hypothetical protein [Planctomycetota bacterium]